MITIGPNPITLYKVGRWIAAGNNQSHQIRVCYGPSWIDSFQVVPGGIATVNTSGATPGQFAYVDLQGPTVLLAGKPYFIMSDEHGGDVWHRNDTVVSTTADATLNGGAAEGSLGSGCVIDGTSNHPYIPLSFQYTVGLPVGYPAQMVGSVYGDLGGPEFHSHYKGVVSGTVTLEGHFDTNSGGTVTYQWMLNGNAASPILTGPPSGGFPWTFDTTTVADGTYIVYPKLLDWDTDNAASPKITSVALIVANHGTNIAAGQLIPCAPYRVHRTNPRPDFITYDGVPNPVHNTYPMAYNFSPPTSDRNAPLYAEVWPGPRTGEYHGPPQWCTTPSGGVQVQYRDPLAYPTTEASYDFAVKHNTMDGPRLNSLVSGYTNYVEDPDVSGQWFGAEINGRIFKIARNGTVTTIFGPHRDRTRLNLHMDSSSAEEIEDIRLNTGTYPAGVDALDGANDVCVDPRDHNILYVPVQLKQFIARINIATQVCTVYAGMPLAPGYVDGPAASAKFHMPTSVIMTSSGIMYVSDQENCAIRRISADGKTVDTLCGGRVGPIPPSIETLTSLGAIHNVIGTIVWNTVTNTGDVVLSSPAALVAGQTLNMQGSISSAGASLNNPPAYWQRFIIASVIDSTHIKITVPGVLSNPRNFGTISGPITLQEYNADIYSAPGTVSFDKAYVTFPNWIRFTSTGNIVVGESSTDANRLINLTASTITRIGCFGNRLEQDYKGWYWGDVDSAGVFGLVDRVIQFKVQDGVSAAHYTWHSSIEVSSIPGQPVFSQQFLGDNNQYGFPSYSEAGALLDGPGHYPWAISLSRKESRMITTGMADWQPTCYRLKQSSDPDVSWGDHRVNFATGNWDAGLIINDMGTVRGFPWGSRPGFYNIWGRFGATFIGNGPGPHTFEDLMSAYPTDESLAGFIQSGMGGRVTRPELTGNDLRDFIYFVRRGTMQGSLGPTPTQPGPNDPDIAPPVILTASASRLSGTSIQVSWTTNKPTIGLASAGSKTQALQFNSYPMYSEIESGYRTSHTVTISVPSGMDPIYYIATAKDTAGNIVHTAGNTL